MNKSSYQSIIDKVLGEISPKGFKKEKFEAGEYFTDGKRAFMIDYDEDKKFLNLQTAELEEGEGVDWRIVSTWMMEENASDSDKNSIANDFVDTTLEILGEKASAKGVQKIDMPSKKKKADSIDIESFTARFLAIFPEHKDAYKANVAKYGEFMYDAFYNEYGTAELKNVFSSSNKRIVTKYFELLNLGYVNGEKEVETMIIYTIFGGVVCGECDCEKDINTTLEKYPYLQKGVFHIKLFLSKPKNKAKYL